MRKKRERVTITDPFSGKQIILYVDGINMIKRRNPQKFGKYGWVTECQWRRIVAYFGKEFVYQMFNGYGDIS